MTNELTSEAVAENVPAQSTDVPVAADSAAADPSYIDVVTSEKYKNEHESYVTRLVEMGIRRYAETSGASEGVENAVSPAADTPTIGREALTHMRRVKRRAEETVRLYPEFDLKREMRDPLFLKLTVATGGDTTAAYVARHYGEIISGRVRAAEKRGAEAVAASVRSGKVRPTEGTMDKGGAVFEKRDPARLSLGDFKRIRENFRKTGKREKF